MSDTIEILADDHDRLMAAVRVSAKSDLSRLVDAVIAALQDMDTVGLFGDVATRHLWDEYCWQLQEGPFDEDGTGFGSITSAFDGTVNTVINAALDKLPSHTLLFLSIAVGQDCRHHAQPGERVPQFKPVFEAAQRFGGFKYGVHHVNPGVQRSNQRNRSLHLLPRRGQFAALAHQQPGGLQDGHVAMHVLVIAPQRLGQLAHIGCGLPVHVAQQFQAFGCQGVEHGLHVQKGDVVFIHLLASRRTVPHACKARAHVGQIADVYLYFVHDAPPLACCTSARKSATNCSTLVKW